MSKARSLSKPSKRRQRPQLKSKRVERFHEKLRGQELELRQISQILSTSCNSLNLKIAARSMLQKVMEACSWESGALYLTSDKRNLLELKHSSHLPEEILPKISEFNLDDGIGGLMAKTQEPQCFSVRDYPSYLPLRSLFKGLSVSSICFLPLTFHETLHGMILLFSRKAVSPPSVEFLSTIGKFLGNAVANAEHFQRTEESELQYRSFVESISDVVYQALPNGAFQYVSPAVNGLVGHKPKEFYRTPSLWLSLVHPDDKKIILERMADGEMRDVPKVVEYRVLPKGKAGYRWVRDEQIFRCASDGSSAFAYGVMRDVTEYKDEIEKLRASDVSKSGILDAIKEGLVVYDRHLKCVRWNGVMADLTGLGEGEVTGKLASEVFSDANQVIRTNLIRQALAGETPSSGELAVFNKKLAKEIFLWERYFPLAKGSGVIGLIADVTGRHRFEVELHESEQILRNVIDTINDVLIVTDLKGTVLQVNKAFMTLLGYSRSEAIGHAFPYPWLLEEEMGRYVLWIANIREKSRLQDFDMTWKTNEGKILSMSLNTTLLRDPGGRPVAMLNLARDISERRLLTKELERRNLQVEMINRVIAAANQTTDFDEIFKVVVSEIRQVVPSDEVNVGLINESGDCLTVYAVSGSSKLFKGSSIPVENTVSQYAIRSKAPAVVDDLSSTDEYRRLTSYAKGLRSHMSLPITLKGNVVGTLSLGSKSPNAYTSDHVEIIFPLAQHLGTIIDRVRLFNQVTQDATYIRNLLDSIASVVYTVDVQRRILEVNKAWHDFVRGYGIPEKKDYHGLDLYEAMPDESLKTLFRNVVDDLLSGTIRYFSQEFVKDGQPEGTVFQVVISPLAVGGKVTGLVFSHTDISELKQTEKELKKSNEQLLALNEISALINTSLKLQDILETAIPLLKKTIEADAIALYLKETPSPDLVLAKQIGFGNEEIASRISRLGSATGEVISKEERLYVSLEADNDERIHAVSPGVMRRKQLEAFAAVPIVSKETILGAMDVFYKRRQPFSKQLLQLLELVGNHLGVAIENALLYEETFQKSIEIERRNKELDDFTYVVSHDLKEPLISIEGFSKILLADYFTVIQGEGKEYLDSIAAATTRMKALIDDLLLLSRVGRSTESIKPVAIGGVIDEVKYDMEFTIRQRNVSIKTPDDLPIVLGNETHLKILFGNLLSNAIKFNATTGPEVEIGFQNADNYYYLFYVRDNGIGIEKEFLVRIFNIFERLHRREEYEGTGAGLAIVKKIVELHRGKIWAESELGRGSTFYFTIPKVLA